MFIYQPSICTMYSEYIVNIIFLLRIQKVYIILNSNHYMILHLPWDCNSVKKKKKKKKKKLQEQNCICLQFL